jgi:hypothetical protein
MPTALQQAYALSKANPYQREHLRDAFTPGWRAQVAGDQAHELHNHRNAQERAAYWRGWEAASTWLEAGGTAAAARRSTPGGSA